MEKILSIIVVLLAGCSSEDGRYSLVTDKSPKVAPTLMHIENAQPRYEPFSRAGNSDYSVRGKNYAVLKVPGEYSKIGIASWYGEKFHGHKTSNGEIYDMYSMSAAHRILPLPSYVEVTNMTNGKKAIVRVNDRGPFHEDRIIDLSYAAASKLGVLETGLVLVKVTLLKVDKPIDNSEWEYARLNRYFVQLVAMSDESKAIRAAHMFNKQFNLPTDIRRTDKVFRVRLGPFNDYKQTQNTVLLAHEHQINEAFIVVEPIADGL
ncbi:septal ring lytic transglycosylase RlpA family protein [Candidatus Enterovibrio altilux]|uniref:Endolytic peptidoglycan transglycosylase RlpA n=1 Tax=Candidatus Enterovibrio altilux TaxID=1927128 RepID=A0A291BA72_9GAMM|nr:septal ring lytic transglycosylase RlpA family protein [Candidatus Enterovibrio luxaltus]ATF09885.1 Rare lipoprotein A precursor [Candidatus Enterovibrio luxaltus]